MKKFGLFVLFSVLALEGYSDGHKYDSNMLSHNVPLDVSRDLLTHFMPVHIIGATTLATSEADLWDQTNTTWVAPTTARVHTVTSTSTNDFYTNVIQNRPGAHRVKITGLTNWRYKAISEILVMQGTNGVATSNAYVIINDFRVLEAGPSGGVPNAGVITATADTDGTVSAQINATVGRSMLGLYGIPMGCSLHISDVFFNMYDSVDAGRVLCYLTVNPDPLYELAFFVKERWYGVNGNGSYGVGEQIYPHMKVKGPAIVKLRCIADSSQRNVTGSLDGYLVGR